MSDPVRTAAMALVELMGALYEDGGTALWHSDVIDELNALRSALALLVEQPRVAEPAWVSVYTMLPLSVTGDVLIYTCMGAIRAEPAAFVCRLHRALDEGEEPAFLFWMPLPKAPT